jgi:hypothetical protein
MARAGPQTRPHRPDTDQKIDIHGVGLIGRTDAGEVAAEMQMMWGGVVDWRPEAKVKIAQATNEISRRLEFDEETANRLWEGMSDVYELMLPMACLPTPAVSSPCASFPRRSSSSRAERPLCLNGRADAQRILKQGEK